MKKNSSSMREKWKKIKILFFTGGVNNSEYALLKENIYSENLYILSRFAAIVSILFLYVYIDHLMKAVKEQTGTVLIAVFAFVFFILIHLICILRPQLLGEWSFVFVIAVGIIYGILSAYFAPLRNAVPYMSLLIMLPLLFTIRPKIIGPLLLLCNISFIIITHLWRDPTVAHQDIVNALTLGNGGIIASTAVNSLKIQRFKLAYDNEIMANHDELTGLFNRSNYQRQVEAIKEDGKTIPTVIYIDINGLHEYNDTFGHTAGDEMIKTVSSMLCTVFGKESCYRIGGDEFVILTADAGKDETEKMISKAIEMINSKGFSVAHGFVSGSDNSVGESFDEHLHSAEKSMYKDKAAYYENTGKDRCRRRDFSKQIG